MPSFQCELCILVVLETNVRPIVGVMTILTGGSVIALVFIFEPVA